MSHQGSGRPEDSPGDGPGGYATPPEGGVYEWYTRGLELLRSGSPGAALQLLTRAAEAEPASHSIREALARAQFGTRRFGAAAESFGSIVEEEPAEDYARFGLGLSLSRLGDFEGAARHLALAAAMRPENEDYAKALRHARATLKSRL
ncbi:tetratricopeptide repeat protein [Actinomadura sp. 6K520]|jgi:Flp pilus assembly protein TadD|uniref:tetratricopeptide repeat protein n=1 Tax=Actinomadura sp. 6K520 TaxID=2530364 RepID=UPI00104AB61F|nr:tetratricopeptide repeat protein [Actinomadura sp. 6K520]TDE18802.1 tetratricopeptide repeat protein [Actinomadura sp. 6K520]